MPVCVVGAGRPDGCRARPRVSLLPVGRADREGPERGPVRTLCARDAGGPAHTCLPGCGKLPVPSAAPSDLCPSSRLQKALSRPVLPSAWPEPFLGHRSPGRLPPLTLRNRGPDSPGCRVCVCVCGRGLGVNVPRAHVFACMCLERASSRVSALAKPKVLGRGQGRTPARGSEGDLPGLCHLRSSGRFCGPRRAAGAVCAHLHVSTCLRMSGELFCELSRQNGGFREGSPPGL